MRPESRKYVWDALQAADRIARFTDGRSLETYQTDDLVRSAVERQFEIIGEALSQFRSVDPDAAAGVPELVRIIAFRNILIHGYASVDDRLVWGVVEAKLPSLRAALGELLKKA